MIPRHEKVSFFDIYQDFELFSWIGLPDTLLFRKTRVASWTEQCMDHILSKSGLILASGTIAKVLFFASHPDILPSKQESNRRSTMSQRLFEIEAYTKWYI